MSPKVGGCGPISWTADRTGVPCPGACGIVWREFMRLGYLRHVLTSYQPMPPAVLTALLAEAPELIMADSASRGVNPQRRARAIVRCAGGEMPSSQRAPHCA